MRAAACRSAARWAKWHSHRVARGGPEAEAIIFHPVPSHTGQSWGPVEMGVAMAPAYQAAAQPNMEFMSRQAARLIVETLRAAGHQALFAGGAVRDHLLQRPAADFDVATSAPPDAVMRLFPDHTPVGAQFGVVLVRELGAQIEVATFRTETSYKDGRHPTSVAYASTPEADVARRDFTINALLLDPATGTVLDFVGGRQDQIG